VLKALDQHLVHHDERRRTEARLALEAISAIWALDERTRGSTFATCQTMIEPWQDPSVAASAVRSNIDLAWLTENSNTLYLCAPTHEQQRLSPVFGGLIGDLLQQAYEKAGRDNQPLPPTLLVMDEAGNTPTRWLPPVASTCAGIGILLVTIWQSRSQIDAAYGRLADSVLTNHGTKVIFSGASDLATLRYASELLGNEEVPETTRQTDSNGRTNIASGIARLPLLPPELLRRLTPGEALLIHGTLNPAHLRARPYYSVRSPRQVVDGR
jgi:type IV secretion system protein VirD4